MSAPRSTWALLSVWWRWPSPGRPASEGAATRAKERRHVKGRRPGLRTARLSIQSAVPVAVTSLNQANKWP